jgi:23S rRNA (guanosine2251-2'-O)-methyltransferase
MRISEGSANHLPVSRVVNLNTAIDKLKEVGLWAYALELGGENIYKANLKGKLLLVIGGEDTGVNRLTREKCDGIITIPMHGKVNSLNASVALGVGVCACSATAYVNYGPDFNVGLPDALLYLFVECFVPCLC